MIDRFGSWADYNYHGNVKENIFTMKSLILAQDER